MRIRSSPLSSIAAAASVAARASVLRYPSAVGVLRRKGLAVGTGLAALRSPDEPVLVREHDALTGRELDAAVIATAEALAAEWPAGSRIGIRGDGGIDFVIVLVAAGLAGLDAMPLGPRLGAADEAQLSAALDGVVDSWAVAVRDGEGGEIPARPAGKVLMLSTGTSGTPAVTPRGRLGPRGVLQLADADRRLRIPRGPVLVLAPPDHGHGLSLLFAGLTRGRTMLLAGGLRPAEQGELAIRHQPATITGVPAQLGRLLDAEPAALDGVRLVVSGSSGLQPALRVRLAARGARVLDCYGSTESGTVAIEGRPLAGVTIDVDAEGGIRLTSPLGGRGIDPGDQGYIERGRLVVSGRRGALIDSGGELVAPDRVAATLRAIGGVVEARVWIEPDDLLGSRLCAEVTVNDPALDAAELSRRLTELVGRAGVPRSLEVVVA